MEKGIIVEQFFGLQAYSMGVGELKSSYDDCDWKQLIVLSKRNKCSLLLNNGINRNRSLFNIDKETLDEWNNYSKREFVNSYNAFAEFKRVMHSFEEHGIRAIVLKGYVLASLYSNIFERFSSDLDIKLNREDRERADKILADELGFIRNEADSKENVYIYYNEKLSIEAHFTLWEDYHGSNIEILKNEALDSEESLIYVDIADDIKVCTLGITEHLILQLFHIIKHYIVEGVESRYFCDISLYVNKYIDSIDFERVFGVFKKMGFEKFCLMYFTEAISRFGMKKEALAGREMTFPEDETAFLYDILFLGKQSLYDNAEYSLLGILSPYVNGSAEIEESKNKRILNALFPSVKNIDDKYSYCKKFPPLLPLAWVHRAFRTLYFKLTKGSKVYGVKDKIRLSEYRIKMMKNAGLIERK